MLTHYGLDSISAPWPKSTVCIGVFDGVHLGHQSVIKEAVSRAHGHGHPAVVVIFDRHPMTILAPDRKPKAVLTSEDNIEKIGRLGVDVCAVAAFDLELSTMSAERFFEDYLVKKLGAVEMVVGHDFAFGHKRQGTPEWLAQRIPTHVHPPMEMDGLRISSSLIRAAISEGRLSDARRMLGSDYRLTGSVVRGQRLGSVIGVPTANLLPLYDQVIPCAGIYAGRAVLEGRSFAAAVSVGNRPTVPGAGFAIEAHLMDYDGGDLYGRTLSVDFVERLRDELAFDNVEQLTQQMRIDMEDARVALTKHG
ncbi:MAG: riboflavin biosynthesis protein RibF [Fimbriimonadales bacterium]